MANYIYTAGATRRSKLPYLVALWSGYYLAALIVCAFALLNQWLGSAIQTFGTLTAICVASLLLGNLTGRYLTLGPPLIGRLICLLAAAAALTLNPIILGDAVAGHAIQARWSVNNAALAIACALFAPSMLLLAAIPPYASTLLIRDRGAPGSVNRTILLCTALGFSVGSLTTARHLAEWLDAQVVMKIVLSLSFVLILLALIRYPPRRVRLR